MQGISANSLAATGGLFMFAVNGTPLFLWIALITLALAVVFLVHAVLKRRKEARDAHAARAARTMQHVSP